MSGFLKSVPAGGVATSAIVPDTGATGDGYLTFFTGVGRNIAGDNDLYFDRATHNLTLGGGGQLLLGDGTVANPGIAFAAEPNTGMYLNSANVIRVGLNGFARWDFSAGGFSAVATNGPVVRGVMTTSTDPGFAPNKNDPNTGIGWAGNELLSLIANNFETVRIGESAIDAYGSLMIHGTDTADE
ncbi:hypothetical protein LCGC14_2281290, partial [marine sediment metagenome]